MFRDTSDYDTLFGVRLRPDHRGGDSDGPPTTPTRPQRSAYLTRALKAPTIGRVWEQLATTAREEDWSHEEYLTAVLQRQVADRESNGTTLRIRRAHFPAVKTLEDFNADHQPSLRRDVLAHLATTTWSPRQRT